MSIGIVGQANSNEVEKVEQSVSSPPRSLIWPLQILACLAVVATLFIARDVFIPIAFSVLLALLLRPILRRLRRTNLPTTVLSFFIVSAVAALFVVLLLTVARQGQSWLAEAPQLINRVGKMLPQRDGPIGDIAKTTEAVRVLAQPEAANVPVPVVVHSAETAYTILGASGHFLGAAVIVFVLAFFLLAFSDTLLTQAVESRSSFGEKRNVVELMHSMESGISRYLGTITLINLGLGIVTGFVLWLLGIPNPVLWGVMVATLNYVPRVGAFVCMAVLFVVGAGAHGSLWQGASVAAAFAVLTAAESYLVTPLALSKSLELSPLAVILSILFWGWLWGIPGGLMAAPLVAIAKIVCDQSESLRYLAVLLSGHASSAIPASRVECASCEASPLLDSA